MGEAKAIYEAVLGADPRHFDALHMLGVIAAQTGDYRGAVELMSRSIDIDPSNATVHSNRGNALKELGELDSAIASYDKAISISPNYADAYNNRGATLQELGLFDAALASHEKAIAISPRHANGHNCRGNALYALKRFDAALASYDTAIGIRPDYADAHLNRGNALKELRQPGAALASYDAAIRIKPDLAKAYNNRGVALEALKQLDAALASYDKAISIRAEYPEAYTNRGNALKELGRFDDALASYDRAIRIKPDCADAHWNRSLLLLLTGDFESGWNSYEWGWANGSRGQKRELAQPLWLGDAPLHGKSILLHGEQGLGDAIQFSRYAKLVAELGARVILEVPGSLAALMESLDGVSELVEPGKPLRAFDLHTPLLSLPLAFGTRLATIPGATGYLACRPDKIEYWSGRLGTRTKPRVGLAWSGSIRHKNDHNRSIALAAWLPYLAAEFEYVSLQKELREPDWSALRQSAVRHFGDELGDFTDTAALCRLMDVVIGVDTSVVHLSAALGCPTWVLLPCVPDWRWLLDRDDSPWYRSMKLYRQSARREWGEVLEKVKKDLQGRLT